MNRGIIIIIRARDISKWSNSQGEWNKRKGGGNNKRNLQKEI